MSRIGSVGGVPVRVPESSGPVEQLLEFAATYNAYETFARTPNELERIVMPIYDAISRSGQVPDWLGIDLARAVLFCAYRADHFGGGYGPYEPMRTLVEAIRQMSGGWVDRRAAAQTSEPPNAREADEFVDTAEYSEDAIYRWWFRRRWAHGPTLCFIGLNPATGDTDGKPRPTLRRVVGWARREGCGSVVVVNLFAYRATKPDDLLHATVDIVGEQTDDVIRRESSDAAITLVAWGSHRLATSRASIVLPLLRHPVCVGITKSGSPSHPLFMPAAARFKPYP
ncbi:MAG: DUF1643 domain-containing protein [Actinobacteria bacterium]|nr:DUF1643 domain-containing protein [Actinomycetota bacterium]